MHELLVQEMGFCGSCLGWSSFFFLGWVYNGIARPIVRGWTQKTHEPSSAHGKGTGRRPFSLRRHGCRLELSELFQDGASGHDSRIQEHGKREEGEGVPLWWLRAWEMEVAMVATAAMVMVTGSSWRALHRKG